MDHEQASLLLEQACDFKGAAREALLAGNAKRAIVLGALGGDDAICKQAIDELARSQDRGSVERAASDLSARGLAGYAGALLSAVGAHAEAAQAFATAGDARRAARSFELAGKPAEGARALEAALRRTPDDEEALIDLGRLLARHGRTEAAVRTLQRLAPTSPGRAKALPLLARCLAELGLDDAAKSARDEMAALGVVADEAQPDANAESSAGGGALLFGRYASVREVATTPHARVIEAIDRVTGEPVAVKIFAGSRGDSGRDALLRFEREARALAQLRHPNVVPLRAYIPEGPAMALAWMAGGSLADRMREDPMAPGRAVEIASSLLTALGEAHRLGILHRDVKPTNVLFDAVGTAHLSDFGAAHLGDLSSTATAGAIGTFAYMSPEQRLGRPASMASDLYGIGAVLYELLTGEPAKPSKGGVLDPPPSSLNPELTPAHDAALARLVDEDPARRPADAFEARRSLLSIRWPERPPARRAVAPRSPSDRPQRDASSRLGPALDQGDGRDAELRRHDAWIGRDVLVLPLNEASLAHARPFARASSAALPTILRVDRLEQEIWIAAPLGRSLSDEARPLSPGQLARLRDAIASLHAAGGAHGSLDLDHLYWHDGEVVIAYPRSPPGADAEALDREALTKLGAQPEAGRSI